MYVFLLTLLNTVLLTSNYNCFFLKQQEEIEVEEDTDGFKMPSTSSTTTKKVKFSKILEKPEPYLMVDIPASLVHKKKRHSYPPMTMAQPMMPPYYHPQAQAQFFQPPPPFYGPHDGPYGAYATGINASNASICFCQYAN
jgi:hypothetical protein